MSISLIGVTTGPTGPTGAPGATGATGATSAAPKLSAQFSACTVICTASNTFTVIGDLS